MTVDSGGIDRPCPHCGDTGVVYVNDHATDCTLIRCSNTCPVRRPVACGACEKAALGEDLG